MTENTKPQSEDTSAVSREHERPLIVQGDRTILAEVASPRYAEARDALARFAELVKSPEHVHTYRLTPLSIWNACAAGEEPARIVESLRALSRYPVPEHIATEIVEYAGRFGSLTLERAAPAALMLRCRDKGLADLVSADRHAALLLGERTSDVTFVVPPAARGQLKLALIRIGYPIDDRAGYAEGEQFPIAMRAQTRSEQKSFAARLYQHEAARAFHAGGSERGGSGVIVLPCGAGKTIVGMLCMDLLQTSTLVLTTCVTAVRQWIAELIDKTDVDPSMVGEYTGQKKEVRPITVATYQMLTHRGRPRNAGTGAPASSPPGADDLDAITGAGSPYPHLTLFNERDWGLIVYDEVHLLPAPVFQATASLQARRRLGLTATLVREDGKEDDVFALIGPKKFDVPWKELEHQGWIAKAVCTEVRVPMPEHMRTSYALADARTKFRMASENPAKIDEVKAILAAHPGEPALVIGMYLDQLAEIARPLGLPVLTGATPQRTRDKLYADFRAGRVRVLAVSKVANFAVDLPEASLAIQVSGTFGSRQEEAQRLGRVLRPKALGNQASFYSLVSRDTVEQEFAMKRQLFLCEQGYSYDIRMAGAPAARS